MGLKESMNSLMSYAKYLMYMGRFFFFVKYPQLSSNLKDLIRVKNRCFTGTPDRIFFFQCCLPRLIKLLVFVNDTEAIMSEKQSKRLVLSPAQTYKQGEHLPWWRVSTKMFILAVFRV